jgi:Helix-turn-helix domain
MSYTHFTLSERNQLCAMRIVDELSISKIALEMNRSQSTISRELKRNSSNERFYLPPYLGNIIRHFAFIGVAMASDMFDLHSAKVMVIFGALLTMSQRIW